MTQTFIPGKDAALEDSISRFQQKLSDLGFNIEEASWLNPVPHCSLHIRDRDCPLCFTNGKGASKKAALASALGEYFERLSTNYFFADFYLGKKSPMANSFITRMRSGSLFLLMAPCHKAFWMPVYTDFYNPDHELDANDLVDLQSGNGERGICSLPFTRQSDLKTVYIPRIL